MAAMRDADLTPTGPSRQVRIGRRAEQTEHNGGCCPRVFATVRGGYVGGGTHSLVYKDCLSSHESPVARLYYSFQPSLCLCLLIAPRWIAEPVSKLKLLTPIWNSFCYHFIHCIWPVLSLFQYKHTSETHLWFHTGLLPKGPGEHFTDICLFRFKTLL